MEMRSRAASTFDKTLRKFHPNVPSTLHSSYKQCPAKIVKVKKCETKGCDCTNDDCENFCEGIECPRSCASKIGGCKNQMFNDYTKSEKCFEIKHSGAKGYGLFATRYIKKNEFIIPLNGEIITKSELERRKKIYKESGGDHLYPFQTGSFVIDSTRKGNSARFVNHSCEPNIMAKKWIVNNRKKGFRAIGFVAIKNIAKNTELTFDYEYDYNPETSQRCLCGTSKCKGWIGQPPPAVGPADDKKTPGSFINNPDTDKKYKQWGNNVKLMLQSYYPGMIRPIARNLFSLVFVVDPSTSDGRKFLRIRQTFNSHGIAMRIGYIFSVNQDPKASGENDLGVALLNLFNFVAIDSSNAEAIKVLNNFLDGYRSQEPSVAGLKEFFQAKYRDANFKEVFGADSDYDKGRKHGYEFLQKTGLNSAPKVLLNGFILDEEGVRGDNIEETTMMEVMKISPKIRRAIMEGKLTDRMNVGNWVLDQKEVMPRINKRILSAPSKKVYVDLLRSKDCKTLKGWETFSDADKAACLLQTTKYLKKAATDAIQPVTLCTVADAESVEGRRFIYNSLQILKNSAKARVGIILNPENIDKSCDVNSISSYIRAALKHLPMDQTKRLILKLSNEEYAADFLSGKMTFDDISVGGMDTAKFLTDKKKMDCERTRVESALVQNLLSISAEDRVVVGNALQVGPLDRDEHFDAADFKLLESMIFTRGAEVISSHLNKWEFSSANCAGSNVAFSIGGLVGKHASSQKRTWVSIKGNDHSVVTLPADEVEKPAVDVFAVVDPLTLDAQRLRTILRLLKKVTNCDIKLIMNPKDKHSDLNFDHTGKLNTNVVRFDNLPSKQLLTPSLEAPDSWIVEAVSAK